MFTACVEFVTPLMLGQTDCEMLQWLLGLFKKYTFHLNVLFHLFLFFMFSFIFKLYFHFICVCYSFPHMPHVLGPRHELRNRHA